MLPGNHRHVVAPHVHGAFSHICMGDITLVVEDGGGQFQIGVGNHAGSILAGDQLDGKAPQMEM